MTQNNGRYIFKRFLSVILAMAVLLLALPAWSMTANSTENSGGVMPLALTAEKITKGSGTSGDPYLIETAGQLKKLADDTSLWDSRFKLTADIDLGGEEWTPIRNDTTRFTGGFDGGGHLISGLYINAPESNYQGLFGFISACTVGNLGVDGNVTGHEKVGGVVGQSQYGDVISCYNDSDVSGYYNVGGIVGRAEDSTTTQNCYNTGDISGESYDAEAGGIVGSNFSSNVQNCYNTGNISASGDY